MMCGRCFYEAAVGKACWALGQLSMTREVISGSERLYKVLAGFNCPLIFLTFSK
jgi:hypothetical protein